ncbi:unnamed protein product [Rotaria sp. Silwood2]|nr:unnamed protein product [Rotaria sp. Silwood2]
MKQIDGTNRLWQVDLLLTSNNDPELHTLTEQMRKEIHPQLEGWNRLVLFYVKWCPHCRRLDPEYERASTILLKNADSPIYLAKLDCTNDNEARCTRRYEINGYPTLRIYRYGRFSGEELNYRNRTTDEIVRTMETLKKDTRQKEQIWSSSAQTGGVKDEVNKTTTNVPCIWFFVGLFMVLFKLI